MTKKKQEIYERIYGSIGGDNVTEEYGLLLEVLSTFTDEDKKELDLDKIKSDFLYHVSMNEIDLNFAYKYSRKLNLQLEEEIKQIVYKNGNARTIAAYIGLNKPEDDEIVALAVRAIKKTLPESAEELEVLNQLKVYLYEKKLYDETLEAIKDSKDPETLVCAALTFEPALIKEVFGSKKNMYLYLTANTFTDDEDIEYFKNRLLSMDNSALEKQLATSAKKTDQKIKQKLF
ncbi:MAG: hypothetical protein E7162_00945 [Firmicutes bacterium]|nr:hypothetical protein [Bacillota bacterium]